MNLPDLELEFQLVAELLPDPLLDLVDQVEDIGRLGPGMGDDEVGVPVGDLGPAEPRPLEAGLVDQGPAETSGEGFLKMQPDDWWP